ncbi:MAG: SdrD B-like domain-containing protein [Luteolibacter sp.]
MSRWFLAGFAFLLQSLSVVAGNPPPTQVFYVPFPEDQQLAAFDAINTVANGPITVFVTFSAATDGTVIYYDHWEDGYEREITNPTQSSTLIFGDGNPANGYPPGNAADNIPAGTVFSLRNFVNTATLQAVVDYDARDKIASYKPISLTKTAFPDGTDTLLAGCVEVFERGLWGIEYRSPVGVDMPTVTTPGALANDEDQFNYVAFSISAGVGGANVQIDKDNNGSFEETVSLSEGQSILRDSVNTGGRILADRPVQAVLFTGTLNSDYASRDTTLLPVNRWSSDYFSPVSTPAGNGTLTFLYNPSASAITVNYDYRNSTSTYATASISVPARGNAKVVHSPAVSGTHFGAYRFYTTGANPPLFYAISTVDSDGTAAAENNKAWDGGFTLVGRPSLTTQVLLSLGLGRDPYSSVNPAENGNPMWICTVGNGHTPETIYVDYNGDNAGALVDPNGNRYDLALSLRELEQRKLFDPDGDQSGMLVYSLNSNVKIAAAWAQDPTSATNSQPGIDVASLVPPLREGESAKRSDLLVDADGDGYISAGDTLQYDIRGVNSARASIPGPFAVTDNLPSDVTYLADSARYRFSVNGLWQAWIAIPDNPTGTVFPLDGSGFPVPGNMGMGQQLQVTFHAVIDDYANLSTGTLRNTGSVEISPFGLLLPVEWEDPVHGSIGDRLWVDADGDGNQDAGEGGIAGIDVFVDSNNNGIWDSGETRDTTDANGNYLLAGLLAGTYTVRVDTADIAAANVGYGPTFDLDGLTTTNVATVSLLSAQDRVDADFGYRIGASVGDRVWLDRDADGVQENGEPGMNGVRVYIDLDNDNSYDAGEPNTITSGNGTYYIGNLSAGPREVRVDTATLPPGINQTFDLNGVLDHESSVTLLAAEHRGNLDFGYRGTLSLGDLVWEDLDANGTRTTYNVRNGRIDINNMSGVDNDDNGSLAGFSIIGGYIDLSGNGSIDNNDDGIFQGIPIIDGGCDVVVSGGINNADDLNAAVANEGPLANVRVYIDWNDNGAFDVVEPSSTSSARGIYSITNLYPGNWTVRIDTNTLPVSYVQTYDLASPIGDHSATVALSVSRTDVDFGYRNDASIGDVIWNDRDADGIRDPGEPGIEGVMVFIDTDGDGVFDQATERFDISDINGAYLIENLASGIYSVRVEISTLPQGATPTYDLNGVATSNVASRTVVTSESATDVDFGYRSAASFGDHVWNDMDADGVRDAGESGINGVRVYADINGNGLFEIASEPAAITNASGAYSITNLMPGNFTARVDISTLPSGFVQTYGLLDALDHSATFFVSANQTRSDVDFGYTSPAMVGDYVWNDLDADGVQDAGESGIPGASVTLFNSVNDTVVASTATSVAGAYAFVNMMPGSYYILFDTPAGFTRSIADQGMDSSDSDLSVSTGRSPVFSIAGGEVNNTIDAGFYQPGNVFGHLYIDTNGNGDQDPDEPDLSGVNIVVTDSRGIAQTVATNSNGDWTATVPPGDTTADVDEMDPEYPADYTRTEGEDPSFLMAAAGSGVDAGIDGYAPLANLGVLKTVNHPTPNIGSNVVFTLVAGNQGPISATGVAVMDLLPSGYEFISANPAPDYSSSTGVWNVGSLDSGTSRILEITAKVLASGDYLNLAIISGDQPDPVSGNDTENEATTPVPPGSITGRVLEDTDHDGDGDSPVSGVVLTLLNSIGNLFDSDGIAAGVQSVTVTTALDGTYSFANLIPGTYGVLQDQPLGYDSVSDKDGDDPDEIRPVVVTAGNSNTGNDFIEKLDTCPDDWGQWKFQHPGEAPAGNPDADAYDNFAEFAFAMPYDTGTGNKWLGATAWVIQPSTLGPGTIEGVFVRPNGAPANVTYILQYAAVPGDPTSWQPLPITPGLVSTVDNGDCTETVTIHDLEALTGLTSGRGVVRIQADLDDDGGGNGDIDHTSHTETEGWTVTGLEICCRTYNNPYQRETVFTGTVTEVSGQNLTFAVNDNLALLLSSGGSFYLEVVSGDCEGQRFDLVSTAGNTVTLASDSDPHAAVAPFNTMSGPPPVGLIGDRVAIHRHWTLGEIFPVSGLGASGRQSSADQIQIYAGGAWIIYWLFDGNGEIPSVSRWVDSADAAMVNQGGVVIPPGQGAFFNNKTAVRSILAYGEIRANDFVRPHAPGNNLVGGGYPLNQSANGPRGRTMNLTNGFFGSTNFKWADSIFVWKADTVIGAPGYDTYYLLGGIASQPSLTRWIKVGDASILSRDAETILSGNRSVITRTASALPAHTIPTPWNP